MLVQLMTSTAVAAAAAACQFVTASVRFVRVFRPQRGASCCHSLAGSIVVAGLICMQVACPQPSNALCGAMPQQSPDGGSVGTVYLDANPWMTTFAVFGALLSTA